MKNKLFLLIWAVVIALFFFPVIIKKQAPAPLDTIVGLYHPWRDNIWNNYSLGVPFKNFLITDPVRQQIPWKKLTIDSLKKGVLSSWNPYSFAGTPLSANIQSGYYYPLNLIFFLLPFLEAWNLFIILAPLAGGLFLYFYLKNFKLNWLSAFFGAVVFSFSGFYIAWLEWGNLTQVMLWLPLILLSIEKLTSKISLKWLFIFYLANVFQLLAGHLQISFYVTIFSFVYLLFKAFSSRNHSLLLLLPVYLLILLTVSIQYLPLLRLINLSARSFDLSSWDKGAWFLPWSQLIQFISPDFFGNPSTLNYWGEWNYGEFIGYIGFIPLIIVMTILLKDRKSKTLLFYILGLLTCFLFILPNPISKIPFRLNLPFIGSAQPTRLLSLVTFILSVLAAFGFENLFFDHSQLKSSKRRIIYSSVIITVSLGILWLLVLFGKSIVGQELFSQLTTVSRRNLLLPSLLLMISLLLFLAYFKLTKLHRTIGLLIIIVTIFDLFRFGYKFISFSNNSWFYPETRVLKFLKEQQPPFRIMTTDRRILPPNFSIMYQLEDVAGYDPLYLLSYAKLVQSWSSGKPEIVPGNFNRILTPSDYNSFICDLLNVKYILSLKEIKSDKLVLLLQEGETRVYENLGAFPRFFLVDSVQKAGSEQEEMELMYQYQDDLRNIAVTKEDIDLGQNSMLKTGNEQIDLVRKEENNISLKVNLKGEKLLVASEINYPAWQVYIDGVRGKIYEVDFSLRGVVVPEGEHEVLFAYQDFY